MPAKEKAAKRRGRPKKLPLHEIAGVPEEFMKLVQEFCGVVEHPRCDESRGYYYRDIEKGKQSIPSIREKWCIGGMTGGDCWGGNANSFVSADSEPDYCGLDELLLEVAPSTTFLQYKKILSCEKEYEYTDHEYYGNYTEYKVKYILIKDLYDILKKFGHVE